MENTEKNLCSSCNKIIDNIEKQCVTCEKYFHFECLADSEQCTDCKDKLNVKNNFCSNCGEIMKKNSYFCSNCGTKVEDRDNSEGKGKRNIKLFMAVGIILFLIIGAYLINNVIQEKKVEEARIQAEKSKEKYLSDVESFASITLNAGVTLEDISDYIQSEWYDAIYEDEYDDINDAIRVAMLVKYEEIDTAETQYNLVETSFSDVKKVPEGIEDDNIDEISDAVKDLYNLYTDYYNFAIEPTGNYTSYSERNNSITDEFSSKYRALENLLE